jgi:glycosyltransferase involved in cell wall biosynthesis
LTDSLGKLANPYEIIFVDDGSTDGSAAILFDLFDSDPAVQVIQFRQNFGKTAALTAAFRHSRGDVVITLDADLQDDPAEIPAMLDKLHEGYDLVAAWRYHRQDPIDKTWPSRVFNWAVSTFTGINLHDFNCGFKLYRRAVTEQIPFYSDFHRFVPVLAANQGFRITEVPVQHHPRHSGVSKYGVSRTIRGFLDFVTVLFLITYLKHPLRFFGTTGLAIFGLGTLVELYLAFLWLLREVGQADVGPIGTRPLFLVGILAMILGIQLFSIGLLGEMLRYFTFRPEGEYSIKQILRHEIFASEVSPAK